MTRLRQGFGGQARVRQGFGGARSLLAVVLLFPIALGAQQRDARVAVGTAEITGVVWTADARPQPLRRVVVSITGGGIPSARSVITDDAGRFTIDRLPAGTFSVIARKVAYLETPYGATRPGQQGSPVMLVDGQRLTLRMSIFKGAVIAGTIRDSAGRPLAGLPVAAVDPRGVDSPTFSMRDFLTDDRGTYRIYGLAPGEYYVVTTPAPSGSGEVNARSTAEMNAVLAGLTQRQSRTGPVDPSIGPSVPSPSPAGFAPIFFPGTPLSTHAERIRVGVGQERDSVNFVVTHVRVATIEGTITGDVPNMAAVEISLVQGGPRLLALPATAAMTLRPPNAQGQFSYVNVPPGHYGILVRAKRGTIDPNAAPAPVTPRMGGSASPTPGRSGAPPAPYLGEQLYALAEVDVSGQDVKGITLPLQPGGMMSGTVVFDGAAAPLADLSGLRISLSQPRGEYLTPNANVIFGNYLASIPSVTAKADGTFVIYGIGPSLYALNATLPAPLNQTWTLRTARIDGRDLLDELIQGPNVQLAGVTMTFSDKKTELAGSLQSASGQPAAEYFVVLFSADRAYWRPGSRRVVFARPATDGRFAFTNLPAGDYLLATVTDLDPIEWQTPAFLEQVAPLAIQLSVAEGEKKVQDLRIK